MVVYNSQDNNDSDVNNTTDEATDTNSRNETNDSNSTSSNSSTGGSSSNSNKSSSSSSYSSSDDGYHYSAQYGQDIKEWTDSDGVQHTRSKDGEFDEKFNPSTGHYWGKFD